MANLITQQISFELRKKVSEIPNAQILGVWYSDVHCYFHLQPFLFFVVRTLKVGLHKEGWDV
jgi:hypothetical protein